MADTVEQVISVKIRALVAGLADVKELANAVKVLKNSRGGSALSNDVDKASKSFNGLSAGIKSVEKSFLGFSLRGKGADAVLLSLGANAAKVASYLALAGGALAAYGVGSFIKEGVEFNAVIESARIGIAQLVANTYDVKDATGQLLSPIESFNAALGESNELERALQKSAIETKYEFDEILQFFQSSVTAGAGLNASLDDLVGLTQSFALAAGAINIPVEKVNTGIKQILTGYTTVRNDLAKALFPGETTRQINDQLKEFRKNGTLVDELNKKMLVFRLSADQVAQSFEAVSSNTRDAIKVLEGEATATFFDTLKKTLGFVINQIVDVSGKTVKLTPTFQKIADIINLILARVGDNLLSAVESVFNSLAGWADYLDQNKESVVSITDSVIIIAGQLAGIVGDTATVAGDTASAANQSGTWAEFMQKIALFVGFIRDLLNFCLSLIEGAVGSVLILVGLFFKVVGFTSDIEEKLFAVVGLTDSWLSSVLRLVTPFGLISKYVGKIGDYIANSGADFVESGLDKFNSSTKLTGLFGVLDALNNPAARNLPRTQTIRGRNFSFSPKNFGRGGGADGDSAKRAADKAIREREREFAVVRKLLDAIADARLASAEKELQLIKDTNGLILREYQNRYDKGIVSSEEFYRKQQELRLADLDAEEKNLNRQLAVEREKTRRRTATIFGRQDLTPEEYAAFEPTFAAQVSGEESFDPKNQKSIEALIEYVKFSETALKIEKELASIGIKRRETAAQTAEEIAAQARQTKQLAVGLQAEIAGAFEQDGVSDILNLQKRISDEFPKILSETNDASSGIKNLAARIQELGAVDVDSLPSLFEEFGVDINTVSNQTRDFIRLLERLNLLAATKSITSLADRVQSNLKDDLARVDDAVNRGELTRDAGRAERIRLQTAAANELKLKLDDLLTLIKNKGDAATETEKRLAQSLADVARYLPTQGVFESFSREADDAFTRIQRRRAEAEREFRDGKIDENRLRDETLQTEREEKVVLESLIASMEKLPDLTLEQKDALAALRDKTADLGVATDEFASSINNQIASSVGGFLDSLVDKPGDVLNSFRQMFSGILLGFAKVILQAIVLKAVLSALGISGGNTTGGVGGFLSGVLGQSPIKKAGGGIISGAGTGTSDSIPAMLSHGEGVIPARRVAQYGRRMIQSIIDGSFVPKLRFASGGFVGESLVGNGGSVNKTRILNILDPSLVKDYLHSSDGERTIMNVIAKNGKSVNQILVAS